jgi:integrase
LTNSGGKRDPSRRDGWQVIVYTGVDPGTGRQRQISRQVKGSRKQAERVETRLKAEVLAGRHRGTAAKTLGEMVEVYLDWREQNDKPIGPRTIQGYRALAEARIKPGIGKLRLPQVDPPALDRFYTALRRGGSLRKPGKPLSASRLRDVHAVVSGALALAARYGWVPYNAAALVRPPAPRSTKRAMPTKEQAREALQEAERKDPELYLFLRLEATGLRPGEVCGLWWRDLDLKAKEVLVGHNVVHAKGLPDGYVRKRTKSRHGDDRPIALDTQTVELLRKYRKRCEVRAEEWGLGERPATVKGGRAWDRAVGQTVEYRQRWKVNDAERALGPEPHGKDASLEQRQARRHADRAVGRLRDLAGDRDQRPERQEATGRSHHRADRRRPRDRDHDLGHERAV